MINRQTSINLKSKIATYLFIGTAIAFGCAVVLFISSILLWGAVITCVLLGVDFIRSKLMKPKHQTVSNVVVKRRRRIINHDEIK